MDTCVLAYSGGLDTSVMLHWIKQTYGCEVIAMCSNLGQAEELEGLRHGRDGSVPPVSTSR